MKINSHFIGIGVGVAALVLWMWNADKEIERFLGWTIFKGRGVFKVERLLNTKDMNPTFATLEEAKVWISAQEAMKKIKTAIPWGQ